MDWYAWINLNESGNTNNIHCPSEERYFIVSWHLGEWWCIHNVQTKLISITWLCFVWCLSKKIVCSKNEAKLIHVATHLFFFPAFPFFKTLLLWPFSGHNFQAGWLLAVICSPIVMADTVMHSTQINGG